MKLQYKQKDAIPSDLRDYYKQIDGKWTLKAAEGMLNQLAQSQQELSRIKIGQMAVDAVKKVAKPQPGAERYIEIRANKSFKQADDGSIEPVDPDGKRLYDKESGKPLNFDTFAKELQTEAEFLFQPGSNVTKRKAKPERELDDLERLAAETIDASSINGETLHGDLIAKIASGEIKAV